MAKSKSFAVKSKYEELHFTSYLQNFHVRVSLSFLSRRTFSLRERDMRQASYGAHFYHSDATTMSEIDAKRRRYEEVTVTD